MHHKRLAIIHTHPIQYNVPWFIKLQELFDVKVFYTWRQTHQGYWDKKFRRFIKWDVPLTHGYKHEFIKNFSPLPASNTLVGTFNPFIVKRIKLFDPDIILIYGWKNLSHLRAMLYFHGKTPVLFRGDSTMLDNGNAPKDHFRSYFLKWVYRHVDYALYVGEENKKYFLAHGIKQNQLIFVPHAVNNEHFEDKDDMYKDTAREWRKELGLKESNLTFLYAGKFEPKKNLQTLIRAFMNDNIITHRLILVGNGPEEEKLRDLARTDKRIIFLPFQNQSQMPIIYRLGHVFILPSAWGETWGLSVNEAMACGRMIIASNKVGCAADLVHPQENGYIFNYQDTAELTKILAKITIQSASQMGQKSLNIIQKWTYNAGLENIKKVFNL